jgi:hypothetical protein
MVLTALSMNIFGEFGFSCMALLPMVWDTEGFTEIFPAKLLGSAKESFA